MLFLNKKTPFNIEEYLERFAVACKETPAPDGDMQKDGWGISWLNSEGQWESLKRTNPIWGDKLNFLNIPNSSTFMIDARSRSFKSDELGKEYNQPFLNNEISFVFNGEMRGVNLSSPGKIGSEKMFNLLQKFNKSLGLSKVLEKLKSQVKIGVKYLGASNLIVSTPETVYALRFHGSQNKNYYALNYLKNNDVLLISSQLNGFYKNRSWGTLENEEIVSFKL